MLVLATLSGPLPKLGAIAVAGLAAGAILAREDRTRATAILGGLALAPILLLADIWHSPQLHVVHRHPLFALVGGAAALGCVCGLGIVLARRPALAALLAIAALPFRVPVQAGPTTSNLLVPLYLIVAAASVGVVIRAFFPGRAGAALAVGGAGGDAGGSASRSIRWLERLLAASIVLYALQAVYSSDFEKALEQIVFFYVPFALLFTVLREIEWDRALIARTLGLVAGLAVLFAAVGFVEYATKTLLLNPKLVAINDIHAYFTVNSVFFDPDIFGRFLALVMILLAAVLLYDPRPRIQIGTTVVLAVLWGGLVLTLSRSSLGALLVGLGALAALRWRAAPVLALAGVVVALGAGALAISPKTFGLNQGLNGASSGRANLVGGGLDLFSQRPAWGYGSGSFVTEYRRHNGGTATTLAASHTIPITIAAEQGVVGELVYIPLVVLAALVLLAGARSSPPRAAIAAAFLALVLHTMLYADFLEDPVTWTLLGSGCALAAAAARAAPPAEGSRRRRAVSVS